MNTLRKTPASVENLESRRFLDATISNGAVVADGTDMPDQFDLRMSGSDLQVTITTNGNSVVRRFAGASVSSIRVNGRNGGDTITVQSSVTTGVTIDAGGGNDHLTGGSGNDVLLGGPDNDFLEGKLGDDMLDGGTGADNMFGNEGTDTADYSSRSANLTITLDRQANDGQSGEGDNVQDSVENVWCGTGNDSVTTNTSATGNSSNNYFWGNQGNDVLDGGVGDDNLNGGEGDDNLCGNVGNDWLDGWNGNDLIEGGEGNDSLLGYFDNDDLRGGPGNDWMIGEDGNDILDGGTGADDMSGNAGIDTADYSARTENLKISLDNTANDGTAGGFTYRDPFTGLWYLNRGEQDNCHEDIENVRGGSGNDNISAPFAFNVVNQFFGNGGNDVLDGGGGADILDGGPGDDIFFARGDGAIDQLVGGAGNDLAKSDPNDVWNSIEGTFEGFILTF
jgi:Ca2+-binding RTX toxin-like protein